MASIIASDSNGWIISTSFQVVSSSIKKKTENNLAMANKILPLFFAAGNV
jgi:hypothetical protein